MRPLFFILLFLGLPWAASATELRLQETVHSERAATEAQALAQWNEACHAWKAEVERQLAGYSLSVQADCGKAEVKQHLVVDAAAFYLATSEGTVRTEPRDTILEALDVVRAEFVPFDVLTTPWKSIESYWQRCAQWKENLQQTDAGTLFFASCGKMEDRREMSSRKKFSSVCGIGGSYNECFLGHQVYSKATVWMRVKGKVKTETRKLIGKPFRFSALSMSEEPQAYSAAAESHDEACQAWKSAVQARYSANLIFATCENGEPRVDHSANPVRFESTAKAYFLAE